MRSKKSEIRNPKSKICSPCEGRHRLLYVLYSSDDPSKMLRLFDLTLDGVQEGQAGEMVLEVFLTAMHGITPFVVRDGAVRSDRQLKSFIEPF